MLVLSCYALPAALGDKYALQFYKVGSPLTWKISQRVKEGDTTLASLTASHPLVAENPSVLQPGLEPDEISPRLKTPGPYSQGLRKPSEAMSFASH
jgi:hypothetical protein